MQEQPKDEPKAQACPKCGGNMLWRGIHAQFFFSRHPGDFTWTSAHLSRPSAMVCDNCGYAEIYATNPEKHRD